MGREGGFKVKVKSKSIRCCLNICLSLFLRLWTFLFRWRFYDVLTHSTNDDVCLCVSAIDFWSMPLSCLKYLTFCGL